MIGTPKLLKTKFARSAHILMGFMYAPAFWNNSCPGFGSIERDVIAAYTGHDAHAPLLPGAHT